MNLTERDERLLEAVQHNMHQPACPGCSHEPLEFACNVVRTAAAHLVAVIWCGHCGHTLNVQFVGMDQAVQRPPLIVPRQS